MPDPFFCAKNVSKSFVGVKALDNVDLTINKGEIHCLIGENGSGKSTLIKVIGGIYKADGGSITIEGKSMGGMLPIDAIRAGVQIIYQDLSIFPNLTVAENISINQQLESNRKTVNWKTTREIAQQALAEIGEEIDLDELVGNLPLAKKQIIAISRAVTQNAKLIIMDEATSSLTNEEVKHLFSIILKLKENGVSTLFVSHKFGEVFEISENITIFRDGKMVGSYPTNQLDSDRLSAVMTGREVTFEPYVLQHDDKEEEPLLSVKNLTKDGQFSNISFDLHKHDILGIVGLMGSGRTEVATALFGLNRADSGTISMHGQALNIKTPQDAIANGIALLPEDRAGQGLYEEQPISDNIVVTILDRLLAKSGLIDKAKRDIAAEQWIDALNIKTPTGAAAVNSLSGGNQQRVVLAKWLATDPSVFILDGPTIGIDIGSKHTIHEIIRDLAGKGIGIIMISDEIQEILDNCNRVLLMFEGRIIREITDTSRISADEMFRLVSEHTPLEAAE